MLTRDSILESADLPREEVQVPEWGGSVYVSAMTGEARDAWEQSLLIRDGQTARPNLENMRARLVAFAVTDENGNRLFTSEDIPALGRKSAAALDRVCTAAQRINRLTNADLEDAKGN